MATRKKKTEATTTTEPTVVVGSHLTVTTYPDGRTELVWDDEALLNEVRAAIASVQEDTVVPTKSKSRSKKKANA